MRDAGIKGGWFTWTGQRGVFPVGGEPGWPGL